MFDILVAMDFDARLARALASAKHGNVGRSSPFGELLAELGMIPAAYTAVGWKKHLSRLPGPTKGSDFERYALPVLASALRAFLDGDGTSIMNVKSSMNTAIEGARSARRAARLERPSHDSGPSDKQGSAANPATNALGEKIDDALSLLEGAASSNNLSGTQRARAIAIANRISQFKLTSTPSRSDAKAMTQPVNTSNSTSSQRLGITDGSKKLSTATRDHGQFGSFPAFDDMDDESTS